MTTRPAALLVLLAACTAPDREPYPSEFEPSPEFREAPGRYVRPAPARAEPRPFSRAAGPAGAAGAPESDDAALLRALETTYLPGFVVRDETSLRAVVDRIRTLTGLPLVVDPRAEEAALDAGVVFDLEITHPISVKSLLNLITGELEGAAAWRARHEAVVVTSADRAGGGKIVVVHDVRALTAARTSFRAPRIDRIRLPDDREDDDGGGAFGGEETIGPRLAGDELVDLVVTSVAPTRWDEAGASIESAEGVLIVVHDREVQARVRRFLADLEPL